MALGVNVLSSATEVQMELLLAWFIFSILVGVYASITGHNFLIAFTASVLLSPLIMGLVYLVLGNRSA